MQMLVSAINVCKYYNEYHEQRTESERRGHIMCKENQDIGKQFFDIFFTNVVITVQNTERAVWQFLVWV